MVTRELIARYLSGDVRASEPPAATVAMTPDTTSSRTRVARPARDTVLYRFRVTPLKERVGLFKGDFWLNDAGIAVRLSGYFVTPPPVLITRMLVTRVLSVDWSDVQERVTHLSIDTSIFGRAELIIMQRPYNATSASGPPQSARADSVALAVRLQIEISAVSWRNNNVR